MIKIKSLIEKVTTLLRSEDTTSSACMVYNSHHDSKCPLCGILVKKGIVHRCGVTNKP